MLVSMSMLSAMVVGMGWPFVIMVVRTTWVQTVVADAGHVIEKAGAHSDDFWSTKRYSKRRGQAAQPPEDGVCVSQLVMRERMIYFTAIAEAFFAFPRASILKLALSLATFMPASVLPIHYESSDSSEEDSIAPISSRRKLPALSSTLTVSAPIDDPSLHQGRVRNTPYVEGQWAAYAYVPVIINGGTQLHAILSRLWIAAKHQSSSLHPIVPIIEENESQYADGQKTAMRARDVELHVSLSRPVYLRAHQRDDLKVVMRNMALRHNPCVCPPA